MKRTPYGLLLVLAPLLLVRGASATVCDDDAQRARLFASLDLAREELTQVRQAVAAEDWPEACRALVEHYRSEPARESGRRSRTAVAQADRLLEGQITILNMDGRFARQADGSIDWLDRGPRSDREWTSYLNRHLYLRTLLDAYLQTGRESYLRRIQDDLNDWVTNNPYDGQKSRPPDMRWTSLEPANRAIVWRQLFDAAVPLSDTTLLNLLSSLVDHAHFLRHHHSARNNHLLREMEALATIATGWPELVSSDEWLDYSRAQVESWIDHQLYPDGVDRELTAFYHNVSIQRLAAYGEIFRQNGETLDGETLPADLRLALERAYDYLARSIRPSGTIPLNNDGDLSDIRKKLVAAARRHGRSDWLHAATQGREGRPAAGLASAFFPWAGQVVLRSGWDPDSRWAFFDIGPAGVGSHRHADRLHLSVSAFGRDLLVDSGRYTYKKTSPWRSYFRDSAGHNVVLVDGQGQQMIPQASTKPIDEGQVVLRPGLELARGDYVDGFVGVEGHAEHGRAIAFVDGELWIVVDRISTDRPRALQATWHFHPDCHVQIDGADVVSDDTGLGNLRITTLAGPDWKLELANGRQEPEIQGWWSEAYGSKRPATAALFSGSIEQTETLVWLLRPARGEVMRGGARVLSMTEDTVTVQVETTIGSRVVKVQFARRDVATEQAQ